MRLRVSTKPNRAAAIAYPSVTWKIIADCLMRPVWVRVEMSDAIGRYDGSCLVDRTAGGAAARCDSEAANMITLNLMHEIVTGKLGVDEAGTVYADQ